MSRRRKPHAITVEEMLSTPDGISQVAKWLREGHSIDDLVVPAINAKPAPRSSLHRKTAPSRTATPKVA